MLGFYTWLIQEYGLVYTAAHYLDRHAGMEYTFDLDQYLAAIDRTQSTFATDKRHILTGIGRH